MAVVSVFGSSRTEPDEPAYRDAVELGSMLARAGLTVATGGYAGTMAAVSEGAASVGGTVIGVTAPAVFPNREGPNPHLTRELTASTISERIHRLVDLADAAIALPGSLGTVTEFIVAWNDRLVAPMSRSEPKPLVAVGSELARLVDLLTEGFAADPSYITCVDDVNSAALTVIQALNGASDGPPAG